MGSCPASRDAVMPGVDRAESIAGESGKPGNKVGDDETLSAGPVGY